MKRTITAVCAGLLILLSGCASEDHADGLVVDGRGGMTDAPVDTTGNTTDSDSSPDAATPSDESPPPSDPADFPSVGTVRLNWEQPGSNRVFEYETSECHVGDDYIAVEGVGAEVDSGVASTVHISTTSKELLHERSGTHSADGIIRFTVEGTDVVADGRHYTSAEGYSGSSMFEYRLEDWGADYRALWWVGETESGAGAVKVSCHG